jgi:hypothetical protein
MSATDEPRKASALPIHTQNVDFPTPPFPEVTTIARDTICLPCFCRARTIIAKESAKTMKVLVEKDVFLHKKSASLKARG